MVQVVSMLEVMMRLGDTVFQSSEVSGAVWSGVLEFDSNASGVSLLTKASRGSRVMVLPRFAEVSDGSDHSRRWSPEVARRSVDCFCEDGGSHKSLVTGYEWVASATLVNSRLYLDELGVYTSCGVGTAWLLRIWICVD